MRFLDFGNITHWGSDCSVAFDEGFTFPPVLKLERQITDGFCDAAQIVRFRCLFVESGRFKLIRQGVLYQADLRAAVGPEPFKVSEHNDLQETLSKLRRVVIRGIMAYDKDGFPAAQQLVEDVQHMVK